MASRSSADKLKPLPPDPDRHQHSVIALPELGLGAGGRSGGDPAGADPVGEPAGHGRLADWGSPWHQPDQRRRRDRLSRLAGAAELRPQRVALALARHASAPAQSGSTPFCCLCPHRHPPADLTGCLKNREAKDPDAPLWWATPSDCYGEFEIEWLCDANLFLVEIIHVCSLYFSWRESPYRPVCAWPVVDSDEVRPAVHWPSSERISKLH